MCWKVLRIEVYGAVVAAKAVRVNGSAASADASFDATHHMMSVVVADDGREQDVLLEIPGAAVK